MSFFSDGNANRSKLLITDLDLDGTATLVLQRYFEIPYDSVQALDYGWEKDEDKLRQAAKYEIIHMVDKSVEEDEYQFLIDQGCEVWIFDHHGTSEWLKGKPHVFHDQTRCGTKIFFDDFIFPVVKRTKQIVTQFVTLVDTYDLWKKDSELWEEAQNLNRILYRMYLWGESEQMRKVERFVNQQVQKLSKANTWFWLRNEQENIREAHEQEERVYREVTSIMNGRLDTKGRRFLISKASSKISITCSRILEEVPEAYYIIIVNTYGGLNGRVSFRTQREDFNLPQELCYAKGHPAAAGGEMTPEEVQALLEGRIWCIAYRDEYERDGTLYHTIENIAS